MGAIQLYIDNVDFSDYIQQETDITETLRKVTGRAQGVAVDGTTIPDLIANKWDPGFRLMPMPQAKMATLIAKMEQETVVLKYTSVKLGTLRTITAMPTGMRVQYAMPYGSTRIYDGTPISFEEV